MAGDNLWSFERVINLTQLTREEANYRADIYLKALGLMHKDLVENACANLPLCSVCTYSDCDGKPATCRRNIISSYVNYLRRADIRLKWTHADLKALADNYFMKEKSAKSRRRSKSGKHKGDK